MRRERKRKSERMFERRISVSLICRRACNCNEYLKLSREDMTRMITDRGLLQGIASKRDDCEPQDETRAENNSWRSPEGPKFNPNCCWAPRTALDPQTFRFPSGAEVQLETVPPDLVHRIPEFFICTRCGKVFWEGTHYDRVLSQFQEVLHVSDTRMRSNKLQV